MGGKRIVTSELIGLQFERLTIVEVYHKNGRVTVKAVCICDNNIKEYKQEIEDDFKYTDFQ